LTEVQEKKLLRLDILNPYASPLNLLPVFKIFPASKQIQRNF